MFQRKYIIILVVLSFALIFPDVAAQDPVPGEYPFWPGGERYDVRYVPGQVLVRFDPAGLQGQSVTTLAERINTGIGAKILRDYSRVDLTGLELVSLPSSVSVQQAIGYYQSTAGVLYAEPDFIFSTHQLPDDPDFWRQYGLSNNGVPYKEDTPPGITGADIHAPGGWRKTTSTNGTIVAIVDSGVDIGHPDLTGNLWYSTPYGYPLYGFNVIDGDSFQPWDDNGHGTHCAGIVGMIGNNGLGGSGVAWNTSVMAIKVLDSFGKGKLSDLVDGMAYASSMHVPVISCSFGLSVPETLRPRSMEDVIRDSDSLFVCSAGNTAVDTGVNPVYPACFIAENVISVASTDARDTLSTFSNWGSDTIHVAAPGSDIYSTLPSDYSWNYIWQEPDFSSDNMSLSGNWSIQQPMEPGDPVVLHGFIGQGEPNTSLVMEMIHPVSITDNNPLIIWSWLGTIVGNMRIEYSLDGENWSVQRNCNGEIKEENVTQFFSMFPHINSGSQMRIRVSFWSLSHGYVDISISQLGIGYRDDVIKPNYGYKNGTSMATPMVSGVAGMMKGEFPNLTAGGLKLRIMESVDPLPSLQGKIVTGGRVNLSAALNNTFQGEFIPFHSGWNHVSVPGRLETGYDTARIFADIHSAGHSILMFVDDQAGWKTLASSDPVIPLQGYWIYSEDETTVPVRFASPVISPVRQIIPGWTSIGGWSFEDVAAQATLSSLTDGWSYLFGYDATKQQYDEVIIRGGSGNQSDNRPVRPYQGYWLYATRNGTYQAPAGA
jgi:subtilisin family serine protease